MTTRRAGMALIVAALLAATAHMARAEGGREGYSYISYTGADVSLVSKAEEDQTARVNMPIMAGDELTTGTSSRAEAVLASGAILRIDSRSDVHFERLSHTYESDDDHDLLLMSRGAASVELREAPGRDHAFRLDTDDATIVIPGRGLFRVDAGRRGTEVYVVSGSADVNGRGGHVTLRSGQYAWVSGSDEIEVESSDLPHDRFTRFVEERRDRRDRSGAAEKSAAANGAAEKNVSSDYDYDYTNADLEDNGSWAWNSEYNSSCWRPNVGADWSPYSSGYWRWSPGGLMWVSYEPWGWLPYHYGNWAFDAFGWCWLPGRYFSPAWVYWNYTPGYLGWCPIGYYSNYFRSNRLWWGAHQSHFPYLRGRVDVRQIDPRGWNYLAVNRIGARAASGDILRADRVSFRPGETGIIASSPLRIERGTGPAVAAVQDAVRRVPVTEPSVSRGGVLPVNEGLTSLLRRDKTLTPAAAEELRRSGVAMGRGDQNPFRALPPDSIASGRRLDGGGPLVSAGRGSTGTSDTPIRRAGEGTGVAGNARGTSWRESGASRGAGDAILRTEQSGTWRRGTAERLPRGDEGWRSPTSPSPRPIEPRREGRPIRDDSGWRAGTTTRSMDAPPARRDSAPAPRNVSPPPRDMSPAPREAPAPRGAPSSDAPRRQGALRGDSVEGWRTVQRFDAPVPRYRGSAPTSRYGNGMPQAPVRAYSRPSTGGGRSFGSSSSGRSFAPSGGRSVGSSGSRSFSPGGGRSLGSSGGGARSGGSAPRSTSGRR